MLRAQLAEIGDSLFGQAVAEVLLFRIVAEILEGQDSQHHSLWRRGLCRPMPARQVGAAGEDDNHDRGCEYPRWPPRPPGHVGHFFGSDILSGLRLGDCRDRFRNGRYKTISPTGNGFDESRVFGGISKGHSQFSDGGVEAFIEAHISVGWPQFRLQLLSGDHFARALQQDRQNPKRLLLHRHFPPFLMDFARAEVYFEESRAKTAAGTGKRVHQPPLQGT